VLGYNHNRNQHKGVEIMTSEQFIDEYPKISVSEARIICDQHDTPFDEFGFPQGTEYWGYSQKYTKPMVDTLKFFSWLGY
tara:strand:+ start:66 stop:305 length:240 start_codon:yes stop_codon:yes gene_type:complete